MNGLLGLNVRTLGVSRDQVLSAVRQLGCAWVLVQDDPDLIAPLKALGVKTIYRQSGDETLSTDPTTFVRTRAEKGADFVYLTNELDPSPEQLAYTMECMTYANSINVKCAINHYSTGRSRLQWQNAGTVCRFAVLHGHAVGLHIYRHSTTDNIDSWLDLKHSIGGLWLVTEYAFYVDAYHGYRGVLNPPQYGQFFDATLPLFEREQMPALLFSGDNWPANEQGKASGFGVLDNNDVLREIQRVNTVYQWKGFPVTQPPVIQIPPILGDPLSATVNAAIGLNLRATPSVNAAIVGKLAVGAAVTEYPANTVKELANVFVFVHDASGNPGWVSNVYLTPVEQDTNRVIIENMPYASESGWQGGWTTLCGETSLYMQLLYDRQWRHVAFPAEITPLTIARYLGKGAKDFTTLNDLGNAAVAYGIKMHLDTGLFGHELASLQEQINIPNHRPVIVLIDYSKLPTRWDQGFSGGHILVVTGYSDQSIICHDPDANGTAGKYVSYPRADFLAAWKAMGNQALVLG